jgi:hypothetical protein
MNCWAYVSIIGIGQADYICKYILRIQQQGIKSVDVKREVVDDNIEYKD